MPVFHHPRRVIVTEGGGPPIRLIVLIAAAALAAWFLLRIVAALFWAIIGAEVLVSAALVAFIVCQFRGPRRAAELAEAPPLYRLEAARAAELAERRPAALEAPTSQDARRADQATRPRTVPANVIVLPPRRSS